MCLIGPQLRRGRLKTLNILHQSQLQLQRLSSEDLGLTPPKATGRHFSKVRNVRWIFVSISAIGIFFFS